MFGKKHFGYLLRVLICGLPFLGRFSAALADEFIVGPESVRSWTWVAGTPFGDGAHGISFSRTQITLLPSLGSYGIDDNSAGKETTSSLKKALFNNSWSGVVERKHGSHGYAPKEAVRDKGTKVTTFRFDFENLTIERSGVILEMKGVCSYEILEFYAAIGPSEPISRKGAKGVAATFTSRIDFGKRVTDTAMKYNNSTDWDYADVFGGHLKCNEFVADVLEEAGLDVPMTERRNSLGFMVKRPPLAGEWGNPAFEIPGWEVVATPQPGDVVAIAHQYTDASGHVGIVLTVDRGPRGVFTGTTISQSSEKDAVALSDWGFRPGDKPVFRRPVFK